jgi:hypothetical protein
MIEGINKLAESVRLDPDNEEAKYNLELLEKFQTSVLINAKGGYPTDRMPLDLDTLKAIASVIYKGY